MSLDPTEINSTQRVASNLHFDSQRDKSEDSRKVDFESCNYTYKDKPDEQSNNEPVRDYIIKNTRYYLKKARYRPGVN